ncbi:hypothetical protein L5515_018426 [Caenorhabditis briggsae]|uniref:Uncharacterized protein n=1 Tax=Caenorhabditis briggsae TaxID=6238 RepID=A0AAE9JSW7_CAEBR|nr:hypothetical protein L5515_018426 [Caenorhabditis briggsae]
MSNNYVPPDSSSQGERSDRSEQHNGPRMATAARAEIVMREVQVIHLTPCLRLDGTVDWANPNEPSADSEELDKSDDDGSGHEGAIGGPQQQNGRQMAREPMKVIIREYPVNSVEASGHLQRWEPGNLHGPSYHKGFIRNRFSRNAEEQDRNHHRQGAHADPDEHRDSHRGRQVAVISPNSYSRKFNQIRVGNPVSRQECVNDYSTRGRKGSSRYESNNAGEGIMNRPAAVRDNDRSDFDSHRGRPTANSTVNRSNYAQGFFIERNRLGHQGEYSDGERERSSRYESRNNAHRSDGQSGSQRRPTRSDSFDAMVNQAYYDFAMNNGPTPIPPYDNIRRLHQACIEHQENRRARQNGKLPPYERRYRYPGITPEPRLEFDFLNKTGPFRRT